jgi:hypothetical protein
MPRSSPSALRVAAAGANDALPFRLASVVVCCAIGLAACWHGQDINGDQLYYHFYSPFSLLHDRTSVDVAAGGLGGFNNPLLYVPFYAFARWLPAVLVGFAIGFLQGVNLVLVFAISHALLARSERPWRIALSSLAAATPLVSPLFGLELGRTFGDNWATVPFLAGLLLILRDGANSVRRAALGGFLVGVACSLKLTNVVFAATLAGCLACAYPRRRKVIAAVASSAAAGFVAAGAYWSWQLWRAYGNPFFPFFNGVFRSPFFAPASWRDLRWRLDGIGELLRLPWLLTESNQLVAEASYRDPFWLIFFVAVAAHLATRVASRGARSTDEDGVSGRDRFFLVAFVSVGFALWAVAFHYARYMMVLTFVAPVALAIVLRDLAGSDRGACVAMGLTVVLLAPAAGYLPMSWARTGWRHHWYETGDLGIPEESVVVLGNGIGFIAPRLPRSSRVVGLGTNFFFSGLPVTGKTPAMLQRIHETLWAHPDHVYHVESSSLPRPYAPEVVYPLLGFGFDPRACRAVPSNTGPLEVCRLHPLARGQPPADLP